MFPSSFSEVPCHSCAQAVAESKEDLAEHLLLFLWPPPNSNNSGISHRVAAALLPVILGSGGQLQNQGAI